MAAQRDVAERQPDVQQRLDAARQDIAALMERVDVSPEPVEHDDGEVRLTFRQTGTARDPRLLWAGKCAVAAWGPLLCAHVLVRDGRLDEAEPYVASAEAKIAKGWRYLSRPVRILEEPHWSDINEPARASACPPAPMRARGARAPRRRNVRTAPRRARAPGRRSSSDDPPPDHVVLLARGSAW